MKFETRMISTLGDYLQLKFPLGQLEEIGKLQEYANKGHNIRVELKREGRSKDANAALWHLIGEMAVKLRTTKEELYVELLKRYGVFTHVVVKPEAVDQLKRLWNGAVVELGEIPMRNGGKGIQLQVYYGSSTYDTQQFSRLLDGTISEAEEMDIHLISRADRDLLMQDWEKRCKSNDRK